ncbi:MAG: hypothetical protein HY275_10585 [Gemmatimonadetes bacterium]|nr:hypothetical protein [Gemmatimonadota bacterium]
MRTMLVALAADVDARRTAGEPLDSVRTHVTLADARAAFAGADRLRNSLFSTYVVSSAIPKAFADGVEAASAAAPGTFVDSAQAARLAFRRASAARRAGLADSAWHDVSRGAAWFPGQAAYPEAAARMAARRGDLAALLPLLDGLARAGTGEALLNDSTIGRIAASDARVEAARARLASALAPVSRSVVHATIADTAFFPEGIASDARTGAVYVSGIRAKGVARVDGARLVPVFTGGPRDGAAVGVAVDGARGVLWVATASLPFVQAPAGDTLRAELLRVRLTDGVVERRWRLGEGTGVPGEMTLAANGDVIVSDGVKARLYRLRAGADSLETLRDPLLNSPQGIAVRDDGRVAFVADWSHGILRWDLATDVIERVVPPAGQSLVGIDGLRLHRGRLVGIQNGLAPARVLAITLGDDGRRAEAVRVLDRQRAYDGDITVGTTVGDRYLFVASSQWPWFDDDGKRTDARALPPVVIRALPLDW